MSETVVALTRFSDVIEEAILWADVDGDTFLAVRLEEARVCVRNRIDQEIDTLR